MKTKTIRGKPLTRYKDEGSDTERTQFISAFDGAEKVRHGCVCVCVCVTVPLTTFLYFLRI